MPDWFIIVLLIAVFIIYVKLRSWLEFDKGYDERKASVITVIVVFAIMLGYAWLSNKYGWHGYAR